MIGNVIVKNAEFSINGIGSITELSSAVMGRTDIFELPACGASVPVYENITVVSAGTPAEYFEKAEAVLDKEKECVLLHEFDEGFIALTLTSDLNSAGYAKLSAYPDNSAADDISLKEAFYKILLSVIEVRYYSL